MLCIRNFFALIIELLPNIVQRSGFFQPKRFFRFCQICRHQIIRTFEPFYTHSASLYYFTPLFYFESVCICVHNALSIGLIAFSASGKDHSFDKYYCTFFSDENRFEIDRFRCVSNFFIHIYVYNDHILLPMFSTNIQSILLTKILYIIV